MNKYTSALSSVLVVGTMMVSCNSVNVEKLAKEQGLSVAPSPLEVHGDSVVFEAEAQLPAKMMKEGYTYDILMQYNPENGEPIEVGTVSFNGDDYADNPNAAPSAKERFAFAFDENLDRGQIEYLGRVTKTKNGKVKESNAGAYAAIPNYGQGIITTSKLVKPTFIANFADHGYNTGEEYEPQNVDFYFLKNSSALRYSEKRGEEGKELQEYVAAKNPTRTVTITGSHSPEGPTDINTKLANERPAAVEKYYGQLQSKYKYDDSVTSPNFVTKPVIENWTPFKAELEATDKLTDTEKDEILSIVNGSGDFVSKELKLQSLSSYKKLLRYVYPPLRNAKAEILQIKEKKTEAEIAALASKISTGQESLEALSSEELRYAAHMTPDMDEKEKIYEAALRKGDDAVAHNNLGAVYFAKAKKATSEEDKMALIEKAVPHFESAAKMSELPEAYANLAGAKLMKGDVAGAEEALAKASGSSNASVAASVNAVNGYVAITKGEYDSAIQYLSSAGNDADVLYNKALAYTLKSSKELSDDFSSAEAAVKEAIAADANNAKAHYLAAVIGARTANAEMVTKSLGDAVKADSSLAEKAAQDLEFAGYWQDASFLEAIKN
ncbi:hypothetical protein V6R21_24200 [Limibacter armeniacum]|uniref:tetratricopeptide repeat protein n=1 Tax=Limibacter armeniacum TaxID=466084 RepID=UPI002FE66367